jgi:hypothetical protein
MSVRAPLANPDALAPERNSLADRVTPRPAPGRRVPSGEPVRRRLSPGDSKRRSLSPRTRKLVLSAHIVVSVGLLGISTALLVLGSVAAATSDPETARAAYRSMGIFTRGVVQPGAIVAIVTGVILSLGTKWGLVKYYWIVAKLALTVAAILCGIFVIGPSVQHGIAMTSGNAPTGAWERGTRSLVLVAASSANVLMLGAATVISVYKPGGAIGRGRQQPRGGQARATADGRASSAAT